MELARLIVAGRAPAASARNRVATRYCSLRYWPGMREETPAVPQKIGSVNSYLCEGEPPIAIRSTRPARLSELCRRSSPDALERIRNLVVLSRRSASTRRTGNRSGRRWTSSIAKDRNFLALCLQAARNSIWHAGQGDAWSCSEPMLCLFREKYTVNGALPGTLDIVRESIHGPPPHGA